MINSTEFEGISLQQIQSLDMVVDWVQVTFKNVAYIDILSSIFGLDTSSCTHSKKGLYGYDETYTINHKIHIMFNRKRIDMGVHLQMSGSACRDYENCFGDWFSFFTKCFDYDCHFTRLDIAIDCYKKFFTVNQLKNKVKNGELVSRFKQMTYHTKYKIKDGSQHSATVHFGSMTSDVYIVIYDKLAERKDNGYSVNSNIDFWTRLEIRFKKGLADTVVSNYINNFSDFGKYINMIIYNYLDFKDKNEKNKQKSRWNTSQFWLDFLGVVEKKSISYKAQQSMIQKKMKYANDFMSKLLAMCYICDNEFNQNLISKGIDKLTQFDLDIINDYLRQNNQQIITQYEFEHLKEEYERKEQLKLL